MAENRLTIKLTADQQQQIRKATGRNVGELHLNLPEAAEMSESELEQVVGGAGDGSPTESLSFNFQKIVFSYNKL